MATTAAISRLIARFGLLFLVAGAIDIGVAIGPLDFGNPVLRFTTAAGLLGGWPILALGLVAMLLGAAAQGRRGLVNVARGLHAAFLLLLLAALVVLILDRGAALAAAQAATRAVEVGFARALATGLAFALVHIVAITSRGLADAVAPPQQ